jgi:glycosyltransferase involved in cell wall biosynthesis
VVGPYQRKLEEMARLSDLDLVAVVPPYWHDGGRRQTLERSHLNGYRLIVQPIVASGRHHVYFHPGLWHLLRRLQPDLVHIDEEPYNLAAALALRAARAIGVPSIAFSWQNVLTRYPIPFSSFESYVHSHVGGMLAGTAGAARVLRAKRYRGRLWIVPQFGVDETIYAPRPDLQHESEALRIGYVGRLAPEKSVDSLLLAASRLEAPWQLTIAGAGPAGRNLRRMAHRLGVEGQCYFLGHVPAAQLPELYASLDVLVLPSRHTRHWQEQFGRVLIEAMACEVAVIGSTSGEISNVIGDAGLVFPEGKVDVLRGHLQQLFDNPPLRTYLACAGRRRVLERYTQTRIARDTLAAYSDVLAGQ